MLVIRGYCCLVPFSIPLDGSNDFVLNDDVDVDGGWGCDEASGSDGKNISAWMG